MQKGKVNAVADMLSRIPTDGHATVEVDTEPPCFMPHDEDNEQDVWYLDVDWADISDEEAEGTDDELELPEDLELLDEADDGIDYILASTISPPDPRPPTIISVEEMLLEQSTDEFCQKVRQEINSGGETKFFEEEETGVLSRQCGPHKQVVVRKSLRQRLLHLAHYTKPGGHPGGRRMYKTLRRQFYWPELALEVYRVV